MHRHYIYSIVSCEKMNFFVHSKVEMNRQQQGSVNNDFNIVSTTLDVVMATLPDPKPQRYCSLEKDRPQHAMMDRTPRRKQKVELGQSSKTPPMPKSNVAFLAFDSERDIQAGQFVALCVGFEEVQSRISFFIGKVVEVGKSR